MNLVKKLPLYSIYLRLAFAGLILAAAIIQFDGSRWFINTLIIAGLVSDIYDGIITRRLQVSARNLRRLDSHVDQIFWVAIVIASFIIYPLFFKQHWLYLMLLIGAEITCYLISLVRFQKEVATQALASKLWTLVLCATLIQVIATGNATILFQICFYLGIISRLEIICMVFIIKQWTHDIPTVYHAYLLRNNRPIKRYKLLNC
ncbi:CDP-alcohol phosphatidyltransferase [Mucilaginibacter sp. Bleaf8]|uniref:CDP-alcohol phosphatidyltransferase family protein n=1 Tax=Mucilaginibacter sp. Bleaf8 TaxID=2834430 RepID=UPI001BCCEAB5|nr:CDP-alcohol phosphatidyltransferase family protein [Mucilaginibacter sp. Bleaf8]MBS7562982.1 CDP-alcohol phosphatidyltransferase [Mucilaginibacter sp. Bleaf8]